MSLTPFDLQLVVNRLTTQVMGDDKYHAVGYAADNTTAIATRSFVMPAAFVLEPTYSATTLEQSASGFMTNVPHDVEVGILTVVQNYSAAGGRQQSIDAQVLRGFLWQAMLGWAPEDVGFVFDLRGGHLLDFDETCFFYIDTFSLRRLVRN